MTKKYTENSFKKMYKCENFFPTQNICDWQSRIDWYKNLTDIKKLF